MLSTMQPQERQIIERKYQSPPVCKLSAIELKMAVKRLLLKLNFITGWALYDDPQDQEILDQQFELKLQESYPTVNLDEIEYAFRNNTGVKDWGKSINLSLIDEVMIPYLQHRAEISKIEEQLMAKKELLPPIMEEITDEENLKMAEDIYNTVGWKLIPLSAYKILGRQGKMNYADGERQEIRKAANAYIDEMFLKDPHLFTGTTRESMTDNFCKKLAVAKYFKTK